MEEDPQVFIVVRFLFIAASAVLTALVLRGLHASQISGTRRTEAILFSVILTDGIFCFSGVINLFIVMVGGYTKMISQVYGMVSDAVFNMSLIASLVWTALLAAFVIFGGKVSFNFRANICWLIAWGFGGVYAVARIGSLETPEKSSQQNRLNPFLVYYLTGCYLVSFGLVVATFFILHGRKFGEARRIDAQEKLMWYLTIVLLMQFPYILLICMGTLPRALKEIAFYLLYSVPGINAVVYGFHQSRWRSKFFNRNLAEELPEEIETITLEELKGLSDITFLAEGASGSVYRAHWLGIDVAMKIIKVPNAGTDTNLYQTIIQQTEQAFLDEANICARLRHPNITLFLRMGHYEGKLGILTEFCSRGSLKDVLKKFAPLDWRRKVSLALQISKGLTYLHARNPTYIHRDLKCSNILVTESWQAKLADFGISKVSTFVNRKQYNRRSGADGIMGAGHFEETSFVGTWRWNAPEILVDADHCTYSRATDMYSFGMCLWEIYSDGDIPFAEIKFDFEVRQKVLNNQRPMIRPSSKCPEQFVELITCCWSQDPKIRPSAVRASQILKNILDSMDVPNDTPTRGYNSIGSFFTGSFLTNVGGRSTNGSAINSRVSTFLSNFSFLSSGNRSDSDRETSQKFFTGNESRSPSTNNIRGTNNRRRFPMLKTLSEFHDVESQFSPNSSSSSTSETISPSTKTPYVGTILEANEKAYESGSINEDIPVLQENQEKIVVTERKLSASKTLTYI